MSSQIINVHWNDIKKGFPKILFPHHQRFFFHLEEIDLVLFFLNLKMKEKRPT